MDTPTLFANDRWKHMIAYKMHIHPHLSAYNHKAFLFCVCNSVYHPHLNTIIFDFQPIKCWILFLFLVPSIYITCIPGYMHYCCLENALNKASIFRMAAIWSFSPFLTYSLIIKLQILVNARTCFRGLKCLANKTQFQW